ILRVGAIAEQAVGHRVEPSPILFGRAGKCSLVHLEQLYARDAGKGGSARRRPSRGWGPAGRGAPTGGRARYGPEGQARCSASQTLAGVRGTRVISTPRSASASSTALAIAGTGEMMPLSPTPFTPSSLRVDGKSSAVTSSGGTWSAFGTPYSMSEPVKSGPASA